MRFRSFIIGQTGYPAYILYFCLSYLTQLIHFMIKAIFFDIDGTLVSFKTHRMPESTVKAIEEIRKKGIKVFVATGRHFSAINNLGDVSFDGYITMNGCYCLAGKDKVIFKQSIPQSDIETFIDYLENIDPFPCLFVEENKLSVNMVNTDVQYLFKLLNFIEIPTKPLEYYRDKEVFQLTAFFTKEQEEQVMQSLPNGSAMRWYPTFADVISTGIDKGVGIDRIGEYFGFTASETIAFGDGGNDVEMIRHAGIGIVMGNADESVKSIADYVTDSVDNDGILKALQHFDII